MPARRRKSRARSATCCSPSSTSRAISMSIPRPRCARRNLKFERRFGAIEDALAAVGKTPAEATLAEMDALWDQAKAAEKILILRSSPMSALEDARQARLWPSTTRSIHLRLRRTLRRTRPHRRNQSRVDCNRTWHSGEAHGKQFRRHPAGMDRRIRPVKSCICLSKSGPVFAAPVGQYGEYRQAPAPAEGEVARVQLADRSGPTETSRCFQMFSPDISRLGYTDEGRVYSIICPQQGVLLSFVWLPEYRSDGDRQQGLGRRDDPKHGIAADLTTEGKIWFTPLALKQHPIAKLLWDIFRNSGLPFPDKKANAIIVTLRNSQDTSNARLAGPERRNHAL